MNIDVYIFLKIYRNYFSFLCSIFAYCPILIRDAAIDPSQCPPSRRSRPRLWTMTLRINLQLHLKRV